MNTLKPSTLRSVSDRSRRWVSNWVIQLARLAWLVVAVVTLAQTSCETTKQIPVPEYSIRPVYPGWVNLHENDPELAGIAFMNDGGGPEYEEKHPAGVSYVFWDGRVRQMTHEPNGKKLEDFWHRVTPWNRLDYSFGSDPNFERHEDPRKKKGI